MAYEIPITAPGLDDFNRKIEEAAARVRTLREERRRSNSNDADSARTARQQLRDDAEAHRQRVRQKRLEEREEDRLNQARQRAERQRQKTLPKSVDPDAELRRLVYSTRVNLGPVSPLVGDLRRTGIISAEAEGQVLNQIRSAFRPKVAPSTSNAIVPYDAAIAGKAVASDNAAIMAGMMRVALPIAAGVAVGAVGISLAESGAASQRRISDAYYVGGGSRNTGRGIALGGFAGMDAGQSAQTAVGFGDRLRGGGYGASYFRGRGLVDLGGTSVDKFTNLTKAIDLLRKEANESRAIRVARDTGLEAFLGVRDLSEGTYRGLRDSISGANDPIARRNEAEYRARKEIFGNSWDNVVRSVGNRVVPIASDYLQGRVISASLRTAGLGDAVDSFNDWHSRTFRGGDASKPADANTQAIKDLTRTIKDNAEIIGGGGRTKAAISVGTKAAMMDENLRAQAQYVGAFTIG